MLTLGLADLADAMTMDRFGALDLRVDTKPDLTAVTDADHAVETALRDALARDRPDDDVLGEEFGGSAIFSGTAGPHGGSAVATNALLRTAVLDSLGVA